MPKILYIFLLLPLLALGGCGDANDDAIDSPHPVGAAWLNPANAGFHGAAADASCAQCHGSGGQIVSCDKCHFGPTGSKVPTGVTWTHGTVPHGNLIDQGPTCNACHDLMRTYGRTIDSKSATCSSCHGGSAVGHATGEPWLNPANNGFHGDAAAQSGANCTQCHGADYLGGSSGVSCSKCHFGPTGSKVPTGVTWDHGTVPHGNLFAQGSTCNACHDLMRAYGKDINSKSATCSTCHN